MDFLNQWMWFVIFVPLAALLGWVVGRRGGEQQGEEDQQGAGELGHDGVLWLRAGARIETRAAHGCGALA